MTKRVADGSIAQEKPSCGKGLADHAPLPAKLAGVMAAMAENLEIHMKALDLQDKNSRLEYEAYRQLVQQHRDLAERLMSTAEQMAGYRALPMGKHDEKAMSGPTVVDAFERLVELEQELLTLVRTRVDQHQKILDKMCKAR
jgi:DNA mismatch repair ATPase MutS